MKIQRKAKANVKFLSFSLLIRLSESESMYIHLEHVKQMLYIEILPIIENTNASLMKNRENGNVQIVCAHNHHKSIQIYALHEFPINTFIQRSEVFGVAIRRNVQREKMRSATLLMTATQQPVCVCVCMLWKWQVVSWL